MSDMRTIQIIGLACGARHPHDGLYIKRYDPHALNRDGSYSGGFLLVTPDRREALRLPVEQAFALYKAQHGIRADSKPNRPLTAFTVAIDRLDELENA